MGGSPALSVAVVIPMYNEETGAEECIRKINSVLITLPNRTVLIVVDDGSRDGTGIILKRMAPEYKKLIVITHEKNKGYGAALKTGTLHAEKEGFEYVLFMDSDLTNDPADIPKFVEKMNEGYDVIKASRYTGQGKMINVPFKRRVVSIVGNKVASLLFGIGVRDCTNGFRAVKTNILSKMNLTEKGFQVIMEELYYCTFLANAFCEIPVVLTNRKAGQKPTTFSYNSKTFIKYLKYSLKAFFRIRPQK